MANNDPGLRVNQGMIVRGGLSPIFYANAFSRPLFPVITDERPNEIQFFRWGLIPSFVRSPEKAATLASKTINARSETVFEKPSFAPSALRRRCVVPITGFYEWYDRNGEKFPFFIRVKGAEDFGLAGIWNVWTDPTDGNKIPTFTILTTRANPLLAKIHHLKQRMPVILTPAGEKIWLDKETPVAKLESLLRPYDGEMEAWPVRKIRPADDHHRPEIQAPADIPELAEILSSL